MSTHLDITAANGTPFRVIYRPEGTRSYPEPLVTFYDRSADRFGPDGQKVSDYFLADVIKGAPHGLDLYGGEPAWSVDAESMTVVRTWLAEVSA